MSKTIGVMNTKGGVGKTTIVIALAQFLINKGHSVCLIDTDPQKSLINWYDEISENKDVKVVYSLGRDLSTINKAYRKEYDYIIIDTPPKVSTDIGFCISCSDFCLIPVTPSQLDIYATNDIVNAIVYKKQEKPKIKAFFVLSKVIQGTKILDRAKDALIEIGQKADILLLKQVIFNRVAYPQSLEQGITPLCVGNKKIINEISNIVKEVLNEN